MTLLWRCVLHGGPCDGVVVELDRAPMRLTHAGAGFALTMRDEALRVAHYQHHTTTRTPM